MARVIKLVLTDVDGDQGYAEMANAVWMLLQASRHQGYVEPDGETPPETLDAWWQDSVNERQWS
jgi:hypothetical protein